MKNSLITLVTLLMSQVLLAWGPNGHRIVAQICYDNLDAATKAKVDQILGNNYLAQIATWPDYIRSDSTWTFSEKWHYVTVNDNETVDQVIARGNENPEIENVIEAIAFMKAILGGDETQIQKFEALIKANNAKPLGDSIQLTALAFLVHFIGDIHQPLHVGKGDDRGGNGVRVLFFGEATNLHSVWDYGIIEKEQLSFTEFAHFVNKFYQPRKDEYQEAGLAATWAYEAINARTIIYDNLCQPMGNVPCKPDLSYQYAHDFLPVIQEQLAAGGFRAAAILDKVFQ